MRAPLLLAVAAAIALGTGTPAAANHATPQDDVLDCEFEGSTNPLAPSIPRDPDAFGATGTYTLTAWVTCAHEDLDGFAGYLQNGSLGEHLPGSDDDTGVWSGSLIGPGSYESITCHSGVLTGTATLKLTALASPSVGVGPLAPVTEPNSDSATTVSYTIPYGFGAGAMDGHATDSDGSTGKVEGAGEVSVRGPANTAACSEAVGFYLYFLGGFHVTMG